MIRVIGMRLQDLPPRQAQVARLIAKGLNNVAIARSLGCTEQVVRHQVHLVGRWLREGGVIDDDHQMRVAIARWVWSQEKDG